MHRRANYHPHVRAFNAKPPKPHWSKCARRRNKDACAQTRWAMFVEASMRKKQAEIERNRFATSQVRLQVEQVVPRKTVFIRVERAGSGIEVCTAKVCIDQPDIFDQVTSQITTTLNAPYGEERQNGVARPWDANDFELFCGHIFEDKALLSKDFEQARFQVCCLAHTNTPIVLLRKQQATWVDVEVRQKDLKARIVRDVRPKSHAHILWSCFPDRKVHKDYKIMIDDQQDCRDTFRGYLCDASSRVVVEPRTEAYWYTRFDAMHLRRQQEQAIQATQVWQNATEAQRQDFRLIEHYI